MIRTSAVPLISLLLLTFITGCIGTKGGDGMTFNYFEYHRGMSFPLSADIHLKYGANDFTLHDVHLRDKSFYPDDSILPNAFITPLFQLRLKDALYAFTEPYYGFRFIHFFRSNPSFGFGMEFIHHKVFLENDPQTVRMTGTFDGQEVDQSVDPTILLGRYSVSHGVNHLMFSWYYRRMLFRTAKIPDGVIQPYVNVSLGITLPHLELDIIENGEKVRRAYSFQSHINNNGWGAGAGLWFKPFRKMAFHVEYKMTFSWLHGMRFDDDPGARVYSDFYTHHIRWGLSFLF